MPNQIRMPWHGNQLEYLAPNGGGMVLATILTLIILPAVYAVVKGASFRRSHKPEN
ncbi:hypothetical protein [Nitrosomonas sp.]|uniref:hypothetical protein n=1 Tax=Nitrosomonas sp. TaxID=42353 RepID=UPI00374D43F0